jgi:cystathionine gamma-synthase
VLLAVSASAAAHKHSRSTLCDGNSAAALHPTTRAIHADAPRLPRGPRTSPFDHSLDVAPPIGVSTTFEAAPDGPCYSRASHPTRERCEAVLASLEGPSAAALLYSSGQAATHAALHHLVADRGARRVLIGGGYHGTHQVLGQLQALKAGQPPSAHAARAAAVLGFQVAALPSEAALLAWLAAPWSLEAAAGQDVDGDLVRAGDVLWLETPKNPACEVADVALYRRAANEATRRAALRRNRAAAGSATATAAATVPGSATPLTSTAAVESVSTRAFLVVDSTFAPPPAQVGLLHPATAADLVMHSTTKSLAGHSDALGGALLAPKDALLAHQGGVGPGDARTVVGALREQRAALGTVPGSLETWLLLRSLRTLHLRVERQCATATQLAAWLNGDHPLEATPLGATPHATDAAVRAAPALLAKVSHPSLASSSGHAAAVQQMALFGGVLAIELRSLAAARALPSKLALFKDATSLGGVDSKAEWRWQYDKQVPRGLVRLSVGLENFGDLQRDLAQGICQVEAEFPPDQ